MLSPASRYFDVACGNGLTSRRLGRMGARVAAFDVADEMIQLAQSEPQAMTATSDTLCKTPTTKA